MRSDIRGWAARAALVSMPIFALGAVGTALTAHAAAPKALIYGPSVTPRTATDAGTRSLEQQQADNDGFATTVVTQAQWDAMTAAQFASYQVLVIGDPSCSGDNAYLAGVFSNKGTWEPVVMQSGGNKIAIGSDPTLHHGSKPGAVKLEAKGIAFAGQVSGGTGAYIDLSCAFSNTSPAVIPLFDGLSTHGASQFKIDRPAGNRNTVSVVAGVPALAGLTAADLQNWGSTVHEAFATWPSDWTPYALNSSSTSPQLYAARDIESGTQVSGIPYILVSGAVTVTSNITLTPATSTQASGTPTTLTATILSQGVPQAGKSVTFRVESGPNLGATGTGTTDASGKAKFTYSGPGGPGTDTLTAVFTDSTGALQESIARTTWTAAVPTPSPSATAIGLPKAGAPAPGGFLGGPTLLVLVIGALLLPLLRLRRRV